MKKVIFTIIAMMWCCTSIWAQRHIVYSKDIGSLQVVAGQRWQDMPIIRLGGFDRINIAFDQMSHEYHRYTYRLTHLESDWRESESLITSDYISGFLGNCVIDSTEESINTTQNYTHYKLSIPNDECQICMSGNYRLDIIDDNDENENVDGISNHMVLSAFFMVNEDAMNVSCNFTTDTDIDVRRTHQQVNVKLDYQQIKASDPRRQIKGYVLQNHRWDNAVKLPESTSINQQYLEWTHCRPLIFDGGNEYHKFEILDIHRNSFNVDSNTWDPEQEIWNTWVTPNYPRRSYTFDQVPKGAFYIRNTDNFENDITSEYVMVHFALQTKEKFPYPLYINGVWTFDRFDPQYEMHYNAQDKQYEGEIKLKYGYYSYEYLMRNDGKSLIPPTEGSFFETKNYYTTLIYYRSNIDRADRLVGVAEVSTR